MTRFIFAALALVAASCATGGANRFINGTEIPRSKTLVTTADAQSVTLGAVSATGAVSVGGALAVTGATTLRGADLTLSSVSAGVTAATGSAQGDGAMTTLAVQVTTSATNGDAVTLPTAVLGKIVFVCNNAAANSVDVFPASGAQVNKETANTAIALAAGECMQCMGFSATRWGCVIGSAN